MMDSPWTYVVLALLLLLVVVPLVLVRVLGARRKPGEDPRSDPQLM